MLHKKIYYVVSLMLIGLEIVTLVTLFQKIVSYWPAMSFHGQAQNKYVALSSIESKYMALTKATTEAFWLQLLFSNLGFAQFNPTIIFVDNKNAIALAKVPKFHAHNKHIAIYYHFILEHLEFQTLTLKYIPTMMEADVFIKRPTFQVHNIDGSVFSSTYLG